MATLTGDSRRVDLGGGYSVIAPGLRGRVERHIEATADARSTGDATPALTDALARAEMASVTTVDLSVTHVPGDPGLMTFRDTQNDGALVLEVPDLGPDVGQVVLTIDEAGALSWCFSLPSDELQLPADRSAGVSRRFHIPNRVPAAPQDPGHRSLVGALGRKLLKVIVYPITDAIVGKSASWIAERWEARHRAYGLRGFTPENYQQPASNVPALTSNDVARLAAGPALLFLHGTFSTANGAFNDIPSAVMAELHRRYQSRVFAFDHFSLSHDPQKNVAELLARLRSLGNYAGPLNVDIVCHSRGGLVARTLALDSSLLNVRRIVFVGVPNKGTVLAEPTHMVTMIDRLTTVLNVLPPGGFADVLDGILIAVKIIGHGALKGLDGLASMNPNGAFLRQLNTPGAQRSEYFAIASNYEPTDPGLRALLSGGIDGVVDRIFENAENDLVVPENGVYAGNTSAGFPIAGDGLLRIPAAAGVTHTGMFGHPKVTDRLTTWLQ